MALFCVEERQQKQSKHSFTHRKKNSINAKNKSLGAIFGRRCCAIQLIWIVVCFVGWALKQSRNNIHSNKSEFKWDLLRRSHGHCAACLLIFPRFSFLWFSDKLHVFVCDWGDQTRVISIFSNATIKMLIEKNIFQATKSTDWFDVNLTWLMHRTFSRNVRLVPIFLKKNAIKMIQWKPE